MSQVLVIDMGSSVVSAAVAQLTEQGRIAVKGLGRARSGGLKQGVVINIDTTVEAIRRAVTEANQMAGTKLSHALIAVGGTHLLGQDVVGQVDLNHREVTDQMLAQAMEHVQRQVEVPDRDDRFGQPRGPCPRPTRECPALESAVRGRWGAAVLPLRCRRFLGRLRD